MTRISDDVLDSVDGSGLAKVTEGAFGSIAKLIGDLSSTKSHDVIVERLAAIESIKVLFKQP